MNTVIDAEELRVLVEKAKAWDLHVMRRLQEGFTTQQTIIECTSQEATVVVHDATIITPFGSAKMYEYDGGKRIINMVRGDTIKIASEVKFRIQ